MSFHGFSFTDSWIRLHANYEDAQGRLERERARILATLCAHLESHSADIIATGNCLRACFDPVLCMFYISIFIRIHTHS